METRRCEPSFGMVNYGKGVNEYICKLPHHKAIEFRVMAIKNRDNPIAIDLSLINKSGKTRLQAQVGVKSFVENVFFNPICTLKRAIKNANKIHEHQTEVHEAIKDMKRPQI